MNRATGVCALAFGCTLLASPGARAAECDRPWPDVFRETVPATVRIVVIIIDPFSLTNRVRTNAGTGVVIDDEGHIVTNAHIVYGAREIAVTVDPDLDGVESAKIVGLDAISDIAVVRLTRPGVRLPKARLGTSEGLEIGTEVMAVGYPFGLDKSATTGIVSGSGRVVPFSPTSWLTPMLQTDAAISPGNSGGPLVDRCGAVIGVNTLYGRKGQNLNCAVPIDTVKALVPELIEKGRVVRPWHGIHGRLLPAMMAAAFGVEPGFLVETVEPGSPAAKIGLRGGSLRVTIGTEVFLFGGDVITKVDGVALKNMDTVVGIVQAMKVGDVVAIEYQRQGYTITSYARLPERPLLPGDVQRFGEQ